MTVPIHSQNLTYIRAHADGVYQDPLMVKQLRLVFCSGRIRRLSIRDHDHDLCCVCSRAVLWFEAIISDKLETKRRIGSSLRKETTFCYIFFNNCFHVAARQTFEKFCTSQYRYTIVLPLMIQRLGVLDLTCTSTCTCSR